MNSAPPPPSNAGPRMHGTDVSSMLVSYLAEDNGISPSSPLPFIYTRDGAGGESPNGSDSQSSDSHVFLDLDAIEQAALLDVLDPIAASAHVVDVDDGLLYRSIATMSAYHHPMSGHHDAMDAMEHELLEAALGISKGFSCDYENGLMGVGGVDGGEQLTHSMPPRPPGGYLEPNCHFPVHATPDLLLQSIMTVLQQKQVDCELNADVFKMKCEAYRNCNRVEFVVRLFSVGSDSTTVAAAAAPSLAVEFQRRFGEPGYFYELYRATREAITAVFDSNATTSPTSCSSGGVASSIAVTAATTLTALATTSSTATTIEPLVPPPHSTNLLQPPPLDIPSLRCCRETRFETLKSLVQMCSSACIDVKANAIAALADLSNDCDMRPCMLESGCVDIFLSCLCSTIADVHRCALTGLANLISCSKNETLCQRLLHCPVARSHLRDLISSDCPQVVREGARTVSFLTSTLPETALANPDIQQCVRTLACSEDDEARQRAQRILAVMTRH